MASGLATMRGMRPAEGSDSTAGNRDYEITIQREGYEDIDVAQLFDGVSQTFDPTLAAEFTVNLENPDQMHRVRVGDVITITGSQRLRK